MHVLKLPEHVAHEIVEHARKEAPNECCGVLTGTDATVKQAHRAANIDRSPVKYTIDPQDVLRVTRAADAAGQDLLGFYHSHTFTEAYPSVTDVKLVPPSDLFDYVYVIVSLADRDKPVIRAFSIAGKRVTEVPIERPG